MKNRIRATLLIAGLLATGACQDLTEVPSDFVAPENFYQNGEDAIAAVNAAYATFVNLQSPLSSDFYLGRNFFMLVEYPTEYVTSRLSAGNERSWMGGFSSQFNSTHSYIEGYWKAAYAGINRANAVIDRVPGIENMDATRRDRAVAEAKFLRALHYYWLAGMFGGVPLKLEETTTISGEGLPRATVQETYAQIATDLTEAAAVLPLTWGAADYGRATRGAALTLLGKAYLQSAGQFGITANNQAAIDAFRQVQGLGYGLVTGPQYRTLFDGTNERANEIIFSLQHVRVEGLGGRLSQWASPVVSPALYTGGTQQNQFQAERPFYDSYATTDVRKDATWLTTFSVGGRTVTWAWTSGIQLATQYGSTGPAVRKYLDVAAPANSAEQPDYVILRYADVLLSLAEAINEVSGPTAEAIGYVNQVRQRAGIGILPTGLTQATFKDAIMLERKYEFAMELHGVFDMRRHWDWNKARLEANFLRARPTSAGGTNINANPFNSSVEKCTVSPTSVCFLPIAEKWKLYPIPADAILLNAALAGAQNPGW
jgi:starch-binding outer membrane protein, SusD/RagB family